MSEVQPLCSETAKVECADCGWTGKGKRLHLISDFEERVTAGDPAPAGQCPKCGALAYLVAAKSKPTPAPTPITLDDRERDTILAGLRFWQRGVEQELIGEEMAIAENGREGVYASLSCLEIDALYERLNRIVRWPKSASTESS